MAYRTILVESDRVMLDELNKTLKQSPDFEVMATFNDVSAALGRSGLHNPNLFLVDIDNPDMLKMLPAFVDIYPNAQVLGLMVEWNPQEARQAIDSGILGCVLKPFRAPEIVEAIHVYEKRGKLGAPYTLSFFSPKGRSGRTTLASLLALTLARDYNQTVALIDADLQFGDLPIFFDIEPEHTVVDAVHDLRTLVPVHLAPYFHKITNNLWLLSSPDRPEYAELVDAESFLGLVSMAGHLFNYVFIDLPSGFNPLSVAVTNYADKNFVVAMINTGLEIEHVKRSMVLFDMRKVQKHKCYPIFTRVNPCTPEKQMELEMQIGYPLAAIFPNEYNLVSIANSGQILNGLPRDTLMMKTIDRLAERIVGRQL